MKIVQERFVVISKDESYIYTKDLNGNSFEPVNNVKRYAVFLYKTEFQAQKIAEKEDAKVMKIRVTYEKI